MLQRGVSGATTSIKKHQELTLFTVVIYALEKVSFLFLTRKMKQPIEQTLHISYPNVYCLQPKLPHPTQFHHTIQKSGVHS